MTTKKEIDDLAVVQHGPSVLERNIERFEALLEEMKEATREAHSALGEIRRERREIERMFKGQDVADLVERRVDEVVTTKLDEIGPQVAKQTSLIYDKVGKEIDKLLDIALGKEFSRVHDREDLRPELALKMRIWMREVIDKEGFGV